MSNSESFGNSWGLKVAIFIHQSYSHAVSFVLPFRSAFRFFFFLATTIGFAPYSPNRRCVPQVRHVAPSGGEQNTTNFVSAFILRSTQLPKGFRLTTQANTTNKPHIHDPPMTETRRPEVYTPFRRHHQIPPATLIGQEPHHQVLQQSARVLELHVDPVRGVGRLLQEDGLAG